MNRLFAQWFCYAVIGLGVVGTSTSVLAQAIPTILPGAADAARIKPPEGAQPLSNMPEAGIRIPKITPTMPIPEEAKLIRFKLEQVKFDGATAFTPEQLADITQPFVGTYISLDRAYTMAAAVTERYRNAGYFLSLAYVPDQRIRDGVVTIRVVEGHIGKVDFDGAFAETDSVVVEGYIARLSAQKPITSDAVESFLLRMNDLPGYSFRAVLAPLSEKDEDEGETKLTLTPADQAGRGSVTIDNSSSRYLGPHKASAMYSTSLLPLQQTTVSAISSLPNNKLKYGLIDHTIAVAPDVSLTFNGGVTKAAPGYTLEPYDIRSTSTTWGTTVNYQWIRQRQENLGLKFTFDGRNTSSDVLGTPLSRDRIRTLRAGVNYDMADLWRGYNSVSLNVTQGLDGFGSSKKGDVDLSRAQATPDFTKAELSLSRLQSLTEDWALMLSASGQLASGPLFSSEEFGYGGQAFGRSYDDSEIVGDNGLAASLEVRYGGWKDIEPVNIQPYMFLDTGQVWNDDRAQPAHETGSSFGAGVRFATEWHQTGNIGLAFPLDRDVATPIYGSSKSVGPRVLLQLSQEF